MFNGFEIRGLNSTLPMIERLRVLEAWLWCASYHPAPVSQLVTAQRAPHRLRGRAEHRPDPTRAYPVEVPPDTLVTQRQAA